MWIASFAMIGLALMVSCKKDNLENLDPIFKPNLSKALVPSIVTVSAITANAATFTASLPADFDTLQLVERGFQIALDEEFSVIVMSRFRTEDDLLRNPVFSRRTPVDAIIRGTTYYVRAYARGTDAGTAFGEGVRFVTLP